jgi:hypothetical protein
MLVEVKVLSALKIKALLQGLQQYNHKMSHHIICGSNDVHFCTKCNAQGESLSTFCMMSLHEEEVLKTKEEVLLTIESRKEEVLLTIESRKVNAAILSSWVTVLLVVSVMLCLYVGFDNLYKAIILISEHLKYIGKECRKSGFMQLIKNTVTRMMGRT